MGSLSWTVTHYDFSLYQRILEKLLKPDKSKRPQICSLCNIRPKAIADSEPPIEKGLRR